MSHLDKLEQLVRLLRSDKGCPWDREQSLATLMPCLREEIQELSDAFEAGDMQNFREELGDCLFVLIMLGVVAEQEQGIPFKECCDEVGEKMVRRHPHVFGEAVCSNADEVVAQWKRIKKNEKK